MWSIVIMVAIRPIVLIPYHRWCHIHRPGFYIGVDRSVYDTTAEHNQRSYHDCSMK